MAQVSRKRLPKDIQERIYNSFLEAVRLVDRENEVRLFLDDLLTVTERVMLAKRLAIAILLVKGWSQVMICTKLNVTPSTVAAVARRLELSRGFPLVIVKLGKSEAWRSLWQDLESLLYRFSSPGKVFMEEGAIRYKLGLKKKTLA